MNSAALGTSARFVPTRPPGPAGRVLVGNLQDFEADRLGFLMAARDEFGDVVAFDRRTTIINGPTLAREVLEARDGRFEIRENFLQESLTAAQMAEVIGTRKLLNPGLRRTAVSTVGPVVAASLRQRLTNMPDAEPFDPVPVMEDVISGAVAQHYFGPEGHSLSVGTRALLDALSVVIGNPFALPAAWRSPSRRRIRARHRELRDSVVDLLERREADPAGYRDLAAVALGARDRREQSIVRIADLLIGSLLAAQRVPAAAAGWMLMLVADHRHVQERLRGDAGGLALAVVMETLRLYPTTWLLARTASREVTLGGYVFSAGHNFLVSPYVIHRDGRHAQAPGSFVPERWAGGGGPVDVYLPFGRGRHRCPGSDLATQALVAALLCVVDGWGIERLPGHVTPDPRTTLLPVGLRVRLTRRDL